jgi:hypothetical protein
VKQQSAATTAPIMPALRSLLLCATSYLQQDFCVWIGGHFTEPNEQKTQQSPAFGFNMTPQLVH